MEAKLSPACEQRQDSSKAGSEIAYIIAFIEARSSHGEGPGWVHSTPKLVTKKRHGQYDPRGVHARFDVASRCQKLKSYWEMSSVRNGLANRMLWITFDSRVRGARVNQKEKQVTWFSARNIPSWFQTLTQRIPLLNQTYRNRTPWCTGTGHTRHSGRPCSHRRHHSLTSTTITETVKSFVWERTQVAVTRSTWFEHQNTSPHLNTKTHA